MNEETFSNLRGQVRGDVIAPGDDRYDEACKVYNAMIDKRPAVIIKCVDVADVITAVMCKLSVRNTSGWAQILV